MNISDIKFWSKYNIDKMQEQIHEDCEDNRRYISEEYNLRRDFIKFGEEDSLEDIKAKRLISEVDAYEDDISEEIMKEIDDELREEYGEFANDY